MVATKIFKNTTILLNVTKKNYSSTLYNISNAETGLTFKINEHQQNIRIYMNIQIYFLISFPNKICIHICGTRCHQ